MEHYTNRDRAQRNKNSDSPGLGQSCIGFSFGRTVHRSLDGIEDYSHLVVIFWMDQAGPPKSLKGHVQSREDLPVAGLFARRGPSRPNPIGVTAVPLLGREKNILRVQGVDAIDGTPLIDIKPYTPAFDNIENAGVPEWCKRVYEIENYF